MVSVSGWFDVLGGVDTHRDVHVGAVVDGAGRLDGDRVCSQLTWTSGATAGLLSWWILSYSIGVRILRAVWRRCRLWKISRYSKIALANSMRVRHRRRPVQVLGDRQRIAGM